jgi:hypothetical protein
MREGIEWFTEKSKFSRNLQKREKGPGKGQNRSAPSIMARLGEIKLGQNLGK